MNYKVIPNILTMLRILLVIPCGLAFYFGYYSGAIAIFVLAAVTDGIDGYLARKLGCQSKLGAIMDPLADKFLVVTLFFILTIKNFIPPWFAVVIISRELVLLIGASFYRFMFGPVIFIPTMLSKLNTCFVLLLLLIKLLEAMSIQLFDTDGFTYYLMAVILFTSIYSGLDYVRRWSVKVYKSWHLQSKTKPS